MSDIHYVKLDFENGDLTTTKDIVNALGSAPIFFSLIAGEAGEVVGYTESELPFPELADKIRAIVWKHNDGMFCEVVEKQEEDIDHLL